MLDIRYGLRGLRRKPGFTVVAVLSLALGIGANTAIFSLLYAVLLRPLPFQNPERLVMVWEEASFAGFPRSTPAPASYVDWKAQNQVFEDMAAMTWRDFNLTGDGEPQKVAAYGVTGNFFTLLGVDPVIGRVLLPEDDRPEANKVAVISYHLWQSRYGGQESIIGQDILLNSEKHTVVGVMPARFQFLQSFIGLWVPAAFSSQELANRGAHYLSVFARMKRGVKIEQARADMETVMSGIARDHPNEAGRLGVVVLPLREQLAGDTRGTLIVLLVAVGLVLLIACGNVANLLLSRVAERRKEIAVRLALGATRRRIFRQLLVESMLLAGAGGAVGLLLSRWSFALLRQLIPNALLLSTNLEIDVRVLGYTLLLSLVTGVIFGLVPAVQASRADLNEALKEGGGRSGLGTAGRLRSGMVVAEVSFALVLLIGAGLLIQTVYKLLRQYSMMQPESVLTLRTGLSRSKYNTHQERVGFYTQVLDRVNRLQGVTHAGYTTTVPLEWKGGTSGFWIEGRHPEPGLSYDANHRQVSRDYLKAIGIPLLRGRHFDESDTRSSMPVAIVNETMARLYWPGEEVVGKQFKVGGPDSETPWLTVVGVAADVRQMGLDAPVKAEMYLPFEQATYQPWFAPRDLVVRTAGDPMGLVAAVRDVIRSVDPDQPLSNVRTMDEVLGEEVAPRRLSMLLLTGFAALALLLASIGIYGVLGYFVAQHTQEIGVRLALGARPGDVIRLVLRKAMGLTGLGILIGLICALALTRLMQSMLFGVSAADPTTLFLIPLILAATAFLAAYLPARRAARVDPIAALRFE